MLALHHPAGMPHPRGSYRRRHWRGRLAGLVQLVGDHGTTNDVEDQRVSTRKCGDH